MSEHQMHCPSYTNIHRKSIIVHKTS